MRNQKPNSRFTGVERLDAFSEEVAASLIPVALSTDDLEQFHGRLRPSSLGTVRLATVLVANDITVRRTHRLIKRSAPEYLKVGVQMHGSCLVTQDGRQALLRPGDYVLYDTTRPYQLGTHGPFQMQAVMLPRNMLQMSASELGYLTALCFSGRGGIGQIASSLVIELGKQSTSGFGSASTHLADAVVDVLAASFTEMLTDTEEANRRTGKKGLLLRVRAFVESRLDDPSLDPSTVAAAHHISLRYLQKLFAEEGQTVTGWIRYRRIEHCRKDLANAALQDTPVCSIAAHWGFINAAHFSRLFKATVGLAPSEYRAQALDARRQISA